MQRIQSYLMQIQNAFFFIDNLTKKVYRTCATLFVGAIVVAVVVMTASAYKGAGKNKAALDVAQSNRDAYGDETEIEVDMFNVAMPQMQVEEQQEQSTIVEEVFLSAKEDSKKFVIEFSNVTDVEPEAAISPVHKDMVASTIYTSAIGTYTAEDLYNLQRIVQAEAGVCDMKGKILVANVVINRMKSNIFPKTNTITDVIMAPYQFAPVASGSFYNVKITAATIEAVDRALAGEDYSNGALFFATTKCVDKGNYSPARKYKRYFEHDGHVFFGP